MKRFLIRLIPAQSLLTLISLPYQIYQEPMNSDRAPAVLKRPIDRPSGPNAHLYEFLEKPEKKLETSSKDKTK